MKRHTIALLGIGLVAIFCLALGFLTYWYLGYLPTVVPSVPIPEQASLIEHNEWSASGTEWYADWYRVDTSPDEIKSFYESQNVECSPTFRRYLERSQFLFSCTGDGKPIGVFHAEIGQDAAQTSTILVVEVAWDAD